MVVWEVPLVVCEEVCVWVVVRVIIIGSWNAEGSG